LISALDYLHNSKFVAHRDLKAENVLLDRYDNIRVIDFGLSNAFTKGTPTLATACGSPAYAAPEMIQGNRYTKAADMWSAGILLYALVAGRLPFDDQNPHTLLQKVIKDEVQYPPEMSRSLVDLLSRLLTKDPNRRMTIDRLAEQPWFAHCSYCGLIGFDTSVFHGDCKVVDREIADRMMRHGIDCEELESQLQAGQFSTLTAVYRMLRRDKLTNQMRALLDGMNSFRCPVPQRPMRAPSPTPDSARRQPAVPVRALNQTRRPGRSSTPTPCGAILPLNRRMAQRESIPADCIVTDF
jgi:serine/threonine protein kinase